MEPSRALDRHGSVGSSVVLAVPNAVVITSVRTRRLWVSRNYSDHASSHIPLEAFPESHSMQTCLSLVVISVLVGASCLYAQTDNEPTRGGSEGETVAGQTGLSAHTSQAQNSRPFPLRIHGFLLGNYDARMQDAHPAGKEGGRFLWADERLRLELSGETANGKSALLFKGDVFHDAVANRFDGTVREGYLDYSRTWLDLRLGRQIITWGVGDLLFVNDVFPKDWSAFFSGRPLEYLKLGVDGAKLHVATPALNVELVAIPFFQPDNLPSAERFFLFDPLAGVSNRTLREPARTAGNTEFALRVYRRISESDASLYAYRGYWRQPSFLPDRFPSPTQLQGSYPRLAVYGASVQRNVGAGLLSLEGGYYDSQDDRSGSHPAIPNSQFRTLVGYQRQLGSELTMGAQYYTESVTDYDTYKTSLPAGFPVQDKARHLLTVRLTQFLKYQTWKLSLLGFYSPSDQDALLIPEVWHAFTDRLSVAAGANIFAGQHHTTFLGQFDRNDNLYVVLRFDF